MSHRDPQATAALVREVRLLRWLATGLAVVILGLGALSAYLLRQLDRDYATLIDRSMPALNELRVVGNNALSAQRSFLSGLLARDEVTRINSLARAAHFREDGAAARQRLVAHEILAEHPGAIAGLKARGADFEGALGEAISLLGQGRHTDADRVRHEKVRPALDLYLNQLDLVARYVETHSQALGDDISDAAQNRSTWVFGVASVPLFVGTVVSLGIVTLVLVMMFLFRRIGSDEGA